MLATAVFDPQETVEVLRTMAAMQRVLSFDLCTCTRIGSQFQPLATVRFRATGKRTRLQFVVSQILAISNVQ
jgi:hypothetical protein